MPEVNHNTASVIIPIAPALPKIHRLQRKQSATPKGLYYSFGTIYNTLITFTCSVWTDWLFHYYHDGSRFLCGYSQSSKWNGVRCFDLCFPGYRSLHLWLLASSKSRWWSLAVHWKAQLATPTSVQSQLPLQELSAQLQRSSQVESSCCTAPKNGWTSLADIHSQWWWPAAKSPESRSWIFTPKSSLLVQFEAPPPAWNEQKSPSSSPSSREGRRNAFFFFPNNVAECK